ncbi:hypothetical protein [Bacillus sp. RC51]|uniref:hypothetical protein n=1 Tax=Bacillus TaxID=1386 RepID=UPI003835B1AA
MDETLSVANRVLNLECTVFIMMFNEKKEILMGFYKRRRKPKTELHFEVADKEGFNQKLYEERIEELRNNIRVVAFKKILLQ